MGYVYTSDEFRSQHLPFCLRCVWTYSISDMELTTSNAWFIVKHRFVSSGAVC
jgi:hypothetical protein